MEAGGRTTLQDIDSTAKRNEPCTLPGMSGGNDTMFPGLLSNLVEERGGGALSQEKTISSETSCKGTRSATLREKQSDYVYISISVSPTMARERGALPLLRLRHGARLAGTFGMWRATVSE